MPHIPLSAAATHQLSPSATPAAPPRVLLEALKSELHFYRDFFWRYQDALRAAAVADPELAALLNDDVKGGHSGESQRYNGEGGNEGEHYQDGDVAEQQTTSGGSVCRPFTMGYELQLAEAKSRSLDEEATTLHEHFRRRISELEDTVQRERLQRAHVLNENIQLREANHALCCEVRRLRDGCADLSSLHLSRLQMIFLLVDEHIWRARVEAEALRYLTLRAVDTPQVNHLVDRNQLFGQTTSAASTGAAVPTTSALNAFISSASSRSRLSYAVSHVFESYYPTTRFAAPDVAFFVSKCEDQFELIAAEFRHRMRALAFPESLVAARRALLRANSEEEEEEARDNEDNRDDISSQRRRQRQRIVRHATAGSRRGLTDEDEELVELCLAAYSRDTGSMPPLSSPQMMTDDTHLEHHTNVGDASHAHSMRAQKTTVPTSHGSVAHTSLHEVMSTKLNIMPPSSHHHHSSSGIAVVVPSSKLLTSSQDSTTVVGSQELVEAHDVLALRVHPSESDQRAAQLVQQFHDPLAPIRSPSKADAFLLQQQHNSSHSTKGRSLPEVEDASSREAVEIFLSRRAIRLLHATESAGTLNGNSAHRDNIDLRSSPEGAVLNGHPPSMMVVACSALDPLVKTQQKLRSSVLQLQRERDDAILRSTELEHRLAEAKASASRQRLKSVDQALTKIAEIDEQANEQQQQLRAFGAGTGVESSSAAGLLLSPRQSQVSFSSQPADGGPLPSSMAPSPSPPPTNSIASHIAANHHRLGALPHQVVDRIAQASVDMKDIEAIARMSQDPSLRGRMMRQMKELHHEVAELLR
ncbi:Hypothetical protein, putative [Bodo saltans]|uniref:Uncharacterized protein n=1 Tax=Bodo saltans TaxID=75058 RepID=A0A0S4KQJ5_BODSA|nr:Hypothetical protein, putative [Bodo saltans]|eukprot:CUI15213.1 Hypothetical protein, putative [Bodo saltans]